MTHEEWKAMKQQQEDIKNKVEKIKKIEMDKLLEEDKKTEEEYQKVK